MNGTRLAVLVALTIAACRSEPPSAPHGAAPAAPSAHSAHEASAHEASAHAKGDLRERALDEVAAVHGAPGPWAVAGYRMSEYALEKLGLPRGSFDLEVVHSTPKEVRYSCIADGVAAHSGASLGKLNLSLAFVSADGVSTVYRNKRTGKSVALRPTASFRERYADTPRDKARILGREVLELPAGQVFEEVPTP